MVDLACSLVCFIINRQQQPHRKLLNKCLLSTIWLTLPATEMQSQLCSARGLNGPRMSQAFVSRLPRSVPRLKLSCVTSLSHHSTITPRAKSIVVRASEVWKTSFAPMFVLMLHASCFMHTRLSHFPTAGAHLTFLRTIRSRTIGSSSPRTIRSQAATGSLT